MDKTTIIREQNDAFRSHQVLAMAQGIQGRIFLTPGITEKSDENQRQIFDLVKTFGNCESLPFTEENDPYGEHDFGAFDHCGEKVFWKIDYYNLDLSGGSEDPSNPKLTHRVLTVMLAREY